MGHSLPLAALILGVVDGMGFGVYNVKSILYRSCHWAGTSFCPSLAQVYLAISCRSPSSSPCQAPFKARVWIVLNCFSINIDVA